MTAPEEIKTKIRERIEELREKQSRIPISWTDERALISSAISELQNILKLIE